MEYRKVLEIGKPFNPYNMFYGVYIPAGLVACPYVSDSMKVLMGRLFQYAGQDGKANPYRKNLAKECSWHIKKLDRIIKEAKDKGFLQTTQETDHSSSEYVFLFTPVYDGDYSYLEDTEEGDNEGSSDPVNKNENSPVNKNEKQKRIIKEKNHKKKRIINNSNTPSGASNKLPKIVKKAKLPKIVKKAPESSKDSSDTPKPKYKHSISDLRNYNEVKEHGATNHRPDTRAEFDSLDKLHALFSTQCKEPYHSIHIPEQFADIKWDLDDLIEVFKYHLKHTTKYNMKPVKSIGKFIFSEGYNGYKSWSPLLFWHMKMHKTSAGELSDSGKSFLSSMKRAKIPGLQDLESTIINKVSQDLFEVSGKYLFIDGQETSMSCPFGIVDALSKYIKEKTNNLSFKLVYITKTGFVDEFLSVAKERNILKRKSNRRSLY